MNGAKLLRATKICVKAGNQIEALKDDLSQQLENHLSNIFEGRVVPGDFEYGEEGWATTSCFRNFAIYDKSKKTPSRHLAFQIILYDEDEAEIVNWEPAIVVMFAPGKEPFELDSCLLSEQVEEGAFLDAKVSHLWRWCELDDGHVDSWMFAIPLVRINKPEDITAQIIDPIVQLLGSGSEGDACTSNCIAFRYSIVDGIVNILDNA